MRSCSDYTFTDARIRCLMALGVTLNWYNKYVCPTLTDHTYIQLFCTIIVFIELAVPPSRAMPSPKPVTHRSQSECCVMSLWTCTGEYTKLDRFVCSNLLPLSFGRSLCVCAYYGTPVTRSQHQYTVANGSTHSVLGRKQIINQAAVNLAELSYPALRCLSSVPLVTV